MQDADPFGLFEFAGEAPGGATVQLHVGEDFTPRAPRHAAVSAAGWLASLSRSGADALPAVGGDNCLGAVAAACLGVAQIFKMAAGLPDDRLLADGTLDIFRLRRLDADAPAQDHPYVPTPDLGRLLMVGAGSVGSAAAYCLRLMSARGDLAVVEKDVVKVENFNRSPIFGRAVYGWGKAHAVAAHLAGSNLSVTPYEVWWDEFVRMHGRAPNEFDVWLPLANEFGVRWAMQNNYPPLIVQASTTSNWGVNHGRHLFGRDDCLADRFPSEAPPEAMQCSTAEVPSDGEHVDAALPFLSMFAGLLVAAELARLQLPSYPQAPNFALFDFGGELTEIQAWDMKPRQGCACLRQSAALHARFNGATRYYLQTQPLDVH